MASAPAITSKPIESCQSARTNVVQWASAVPNSSIGKPIRNSASTVRCSGSWSRSRSSRTAFGVSAARAMATTSIAMDKTCGSD